MKDITKREIIDLVNTCNFKLNSVSNDAINEVCEILNYISDNNTVPRNIREAASQSVDLLNDEEQDQSVKISTVLGKLDEISNDPNIPVHARTLIWEVLSKLEAI